MLLPAQVANVVVLVAYFIFGYITGFGLGWEERVPDDFINYLQPFPAAFAIWFVIYAGEIVFALWQISQRPNSAPDARLAVIQVMALPWCTAHVLTIAWMVLPLASFFARAAMLTAAAVAMGVAHGHVAPLKEGADYWCMTGVVGIHFGWLTAASLLSWNSWVASTTQDVAVNLAETVASIIIAFSAGAFFAVRRRSATLGGAVAWAITWIAVEHFFPRSDERLLKYNTDFGETGRYLLAGFELSAAVALAGVAFYVYQKKGS